MNKSILKDAKRCLKCKNPSCTKGCPVNTSIKEMISMLLEGDILESGKMLFNNNPLSLVCSLVCPHEKQCVGSCVLGIKGEPVPINSIENYISDYYLNFISKNIEIDKNKKVGIIGSGPAGISIALILAQKGFDITIFEAHDNIGGVLRYGIPEFRLPKAILDRYLVIMKKLGIKIRFNTLIGPVLTVDDLFRDGYRAVFIGTGVWKPNTLKIKGESLGNVHYAIDYLKNPDVYDLGKKLTIIGAGNVAMDTARTALRKGVLEVYIMYREGMEEMTADRHEIEYALLDGVKFTLYKSPVEIKEEGILYIKTKVELLEDNTKKLTYIEGSEELFPSDSVIISVSQGPRDNIVSTTKGINIDNKGLVSTDNFGRTSREGVFASGDVVTGAKTVAKAVQLTKEVAKTIEEYVENQINGEMLLK